MRVDSLGEFFLAQLLGKIGLMQRNALYLIDFRDEILAGVGGERGTDRPVELLRPSRRHCSCDPQIVAGLFVARFQIERNNQISAQPEWHSWEGISDGHAV
jgi:hypothetical protein